HANRDILLGALENDAFVERALKDTKILRALREKIVDAPGGLEHLTEKQEQSLKFFFGGDVQLPSSTDSAKPEKSLEFLGKAKEYSAFRQGDAVVVRAIGSHGSTGYEHVRLEQLPTDGPIPHIVFYAKPPEGVEFTVMVPFKVEKSFKISDSIDKIIIVDHEGQLEISIQPDNADTKKEVIEKQPEPSKPETDLDGAARKAKEDPAALRKMIAEDPAFAEKLVAALEKVQKLPAILEKYEEVFNVIKAENAALRDRLNKILPPEKKE
ncbi:MAG: hypothetical protein AAB853_00420, partial [Patescibacteria group bacterium]